MLIYNILRYKGGLKWKDFTHLGDLNI
jgi:hypothetical protein